MVKSEDVKKIVEFIKVHPLGVLGTVSVTGEPFGAAVYFGTDDELNLYFITKSETQKNKNIVENTLVSMTFADEASEQTVEAGGEVSVIMNNEQRHEAIAALSQVKHASNDWLPPLPKIDAGYYIVYKVTPSYARLISYDNKGIEEGGEVVSL